MAILSKFVGNLLNFVFKLLVQNNTFYGKMNIYIYMSQPSRRSELEM